MSHRVAWSDSAVETTSFKSAAICFDEDSRVNRPAE